MIASHSREPKNRNMSPKFSKLAKGDPELSYGKKTSFSVDGLGAPQPPGSRILEFVKFDVRRDFNS